MPVLSSTWSATVESFLGFGSWGISGCGAGDGLERVDGTQRTADSRQEVATRRVADGEHPVDEVARSERSLRSVRSLPPGGSTDRLDGAPARIGPVVATADLLVDPGPETRRVTRRATSGTAYPAPAATRSAAERLVVHGSTGRTAVRRADTARRACGASTAARVSRTPQSASSPLGVRPRPTPTSPRTPGSVERPARAAAARSWARSPRTPGSGSQPSPADPRGAGRTRAGRSSRAATTSARGRRTRPSPTTTCPPGSTPQRTSVDGSARRTPMGRATASEASTARTRSCAPRSR